MKRSEDLWVSALESLGKEDRQHIVFDQEDRLDILSDLQALTQAASDECIQKRWRFRRPDNGEVIILRDLLGKIVSWVNLFKQIGDNAVQYDPQHAALPWAGIRFVLQAAISDIVKFEFVVESVEATARMISRYAIFEDIYLRQSSPATHKLKEALVSLYAAILVYLCKAKAFFQQSTPKRLVKSVFVAEEEFQELLTNINLEQSEVDRCAMSVPTERQNTISETFGALAIDEDKKHAELLHILRTLDGPIDRMDTHLQVLEDHLEASKRTEILSWISSQPYLEHHEQIKRNDVPGRGDWLLEDPLYTRWHKESACSLIWLHGKVGSGKSTLTAIVIDDVMKRATAGQNPPPVYFYCSRSIAEPERSNPATILASIVRQLLSMHPMVPLSQSVVEKYERKGQGFSSSGLSLDECRDIILEMVGQSRMTTVVIDALDEIDLQKRYTLLQAFEDILQEAHGLVKLFVSSRDDQDIVCVLNDYPSLHIASDKNQRDIEQFVQAETERLISKRRLLRYSKCKEELKSHIIERVSKGADGMFRWAVLQLEVLCTLKLDADVKNTLGRLPPNLEELYVEIYEQQISQYHGKAGRATIGHILKWLLFAHRQMNSFEFCTAVTLNLPISAGELDKEHILDLCHNFVIYDDTLDTFRFAHLSVREFLETRAEYAQIPCHVLAAETCLIQLIGSTNTGTARDFLKNECAFEDFSKLASASESMVGSFHKYATIYWIPHCASIGEEGRQKDSHFQRLFRFFLFTDCGTLSPLDAWMLSYRHCPYDEYAPFYLRRALDNYSTPVIAPLFLACAFGFCEILRESLENLRLSVQESREAWEIALLGEQDEALKILLTQRGDREIPRSFVEMVAGNMKVETLDWVLSQAPDTPITADLIKIVSGARRWSGRSDGADILFNRINASRMSKQILAAAAGQLSGSRFQDLLDRYPSFDVSEDMLVEAVSQENWEVMELLLDNSELQLTTRALEGALERCDVSGLRKMLMRSTNTITPRAMRLAATNKDCSVLQLLLDYGGTVSHSVLVVAAACGYEPVLNILLHGDRAVSKVMLRMGARNWRDADGVGRLLLAKANITLVEEELSEMMKSASLVHRETQTLELLIDRVKDGMISEDVFMAVAQNDRSDVRTLKLMMRVSKKNLLTMEVLEALAENLASIASMQLLLEQIDVIGVSKQLLKAAAKNLRFGDELVKMMLERVGASDFTECLWDIGAANVGCGLEILVLLEKAAGRLEITESLLEKTASEGAVRTMAFLLRRSGDRSFTEKVIAGEIETPVNSTMFGLLLEQAVDLPISDTFLAKAARNSTIESFQLVWSRCQTPKVSSILLQAAAENPQRLEIIKFLLDQIESIDINEDFITAVIIVAGASEAAEILELCIERNLPLNITRKVLVGAAGNPATSESLMKLLLERAENIALNDEIFRSAAAAGQQELLKLCASHYGTGEVLPQWNKIANLYNAAAKRACYFDRFPFPELYSTEPCCEHDADLSLVQDLLEKETPFDLPDGNGSTPLALAARAGNELIVELLLEAGADPNSRDREGASPLLNAAAWGHHGIAVTLLEKGADLDAVDIEGRSAAEMAKDRAHMRVYRMLKDYKRETQ